MSACTGPPARLSWARRTDGLSRWKQTRRATDPELTLVSVCKHWWVLPLPHGAAWDEGVCKLCQATKLFPVSLEAMGLQDFNRAIVRTREAFEEAESIL